MSALNLTIGVDERDVDISLHVESGHTLALLGPNGAGKSTVLGAVAGTLRPDRGRVTVGERTLVDLPGTWVAPHRREVALLAQEALLFPHLSVLDNVAFGPRSVGRPRAQAHAIARERLAAVDALALADRPPSALSGGQAQRVAVARALATDPQVMLLDEPMAALDVTAVPAMRQVLRVALTDRTAILVTHDVLDALLLADRVAVIEAGRVVEHGPTSEILTRPRSAFGARLAGLNLVRGYYRGGAVVSDQGQMIAGATDQHLNDGDAAVAVFSPASVSVFLHEPTGSPRTVLATTLTDIEPRGEVVRVHTRAEVSADVTLAAVADLALTSGTEVFLAVKAAEVRVYPA